MGGLRKLSPGQVTLLIAKADKRMEVDTQRFPKGREIVLVCRGWEISGVSLGRKKEEVRDLSLRT